MTITDSRPNEQVQLRLDFYKPMAGTSAVEFALIPDGAQTTVTWSTSGRNNFMAKAVSLFMDCDAMIGGQFEQGGHSVLGRGRWQRMNIAENGPFGRELSLAWVSLGSILDGTVHSRQDRPFSTGPSFLRLAPGLLWR